MESSLTFSSHSALGMLMQNSVSILLQLLMHSKQRPRHWDNSFGSGLSEHVPISTHVSCQKKKMLVTVVKQQQQEGQVELQEENLQGRVVVFMEVGAHAQLEEAKVAKRGQLVHHHRRRHQKCITAG
jgi:hypothetical protein